MRQRLVLNCVLNHIFIAGVCGVCFNFKCVRLSVSAIQKKEALSDSKLPEEFRVAIAKSLVDDLFSKV